MAESAQYVTLGIAEELFAIPVECVQEILEMRPIARMPNAPEHFLGMIDVRGQGIPVIDLRLKLGLSASEDTHNTRIIVLRANVEGRDLVLGLKADRVYEVTVLDEDKLEAAPDIGARWRSECITGIGRRNGKFVTVLNLDRVVAVSDIAAVSMAAA